MLFCFCPTAVDTTIDKHKALQVMRWATFLYNFRTTIEHLEWEKNTVPDIWPGVWKL